MKKSKTYLVIVAIALAIVSTFSCDIDNTEIYEGQDNQACDTNVDSLVGSYAWSLNENVVVTIADNATISYRQDGVHNSFATICITPDGNYIKTTNIYDQVAYISFSIVDAGDVQGIVLDGEFYSTL